MQIWIFIPVLGAVDYCCRKGPCGMYGVEWENGRCAALVWNKEQRKWLCNEVLCATGDRRDQLIKHLAIGAGCCSVFNTYRQAEYVPTPEDLKNEDELLRRLSRKLGNGVKHG